LSRTAQLLTGQADLDLVSAFQDGSVDAFDQLFLRYNGAITSLTNRLVRDPLLAEDLTQETFFRVLRSLERVDASFNFSAWIHRIATNLCYDELRRRKPGQAAQAQGTRVSASIGGPEEVLGSLPSKDMTGSPEDALATRELRREMGEVAAQLPENYRNVLILREFRGLSYASIAQAMSLSEPAIETLLHRARRRFKAEYLYLGFVNCKDEECHDSVQELIGSVGLQSLKAGQRSAVQDHIAQCAECGAVVMPIR